MYTYDLSSFFLHVSKSLKGSLFQPPIALFFDIQQKNNSWFLRIFYLHSFPWNAKKKNGEMGPKTTGILTTHIALPKEVTSEDLIFLACTNIVRIPNINFQIDPLFWLGNPLKPPPHLETSIFAALHGNLLPQVLLASSVLRQFNRRFQWTRIQRNPLECLRHWYTLHLVDTPWILCHYSPFTQNK